MERSLSPALSAHVLAELSTIALTETDFIYIGAEIGIVMLLLFLGLEFNLNRLIAAKGPYDCVRSLSPTPIGGSEGIASTSSSTR